MKKYYLITFLSLVLCFNVFSQPQAPIGKSWQKVEGLSDEFDSFDHTKWYDYNTNNWAGKNPELF